jgi:starch synthase
MARPLKILFVAAEAAPFSKTGGLAEVVRDLPKALRQRGHDVRTVVPRHRGPMPYPVYRDPAPLGVPIGAGEAWCAMLEPQMPADEGPVYLLEHNGYFDRPGIYGDPWDYGDNLDRFTILSRGALQLCKAKDFYPDVIHAHDWHTGLIPVYLNTLERTPPLGSAASVFTIHNLGYQGWFPAAALPVTQIGWDQFHMRSMEAYGQINFLKSGIYHATVITTVSPTYSQEIQTPGLGHGLDGVLRDRSAELFGVLNGIDDAVWDPENDPLIPARYSARALEGKAICKHELQRLCGFEPSPNVPLIGIVTRLAYQKGIDVVAGAMQGLLDLGIQIVVLGTGDSALESRLRTWSRVRPDQLSAHVMWSEELAHWIEAGSDFFLMPSRYEPCGLNQMYSLRYGTLPIVRAVGGLEDTVVNCDPATGRGTGFKFHDLDGNALWNTVRWAVQIYRSQPDLIFHMRQRAMSLRLGWDQAAGIYEKLYHLAVARRTGRWP